MGKRYLIFYVSSFLFLISCDLETQRQPFLEKSQIKLMTLDPGHFHAALIQKSGYDEIDNNVYVFGTTGDDLNFHLNRIDGFNSRPENPTHWNSIVYQGEDFFDKMIQEKPGNTVVLAGNNRLKTDYILKSLKAGLNVYADKPMAINSINFEVLKEAFTVAEAKNLMLYDIMTERYEITTILQRELSMIPEIFGELEVGTEDNPAVTKESIHHFFKYVSGSPLIRPTWFFDVKQQGEGIVDVTTHLVDLIQWECFPEEIIDYKKDIELMSAKRWPTLLTQSQFEQVTKEISFPDYLLPIVQSDSVLPVYSNGEINYKIKGIHAKASVAWAYPAPEGAGDTHYSIMRGTKANLVIRQGAEQQYRAELYIEPNDPSEEYEDILKLYFELVQSKFPEILLVKKQSGWEVKIPEVYKVGHEDHFAQVTEKYIEYYFNGTMPKWEIPNMLAKYYVTTQALELAMKNESNKQD